jgi:microcystin-dependent protein
VSQPYVGEIRMFAGNFAPAGWALCQGQLMPISENETLFNLIGTTYGGDGVNTFAVPNLQSRVPVHVGPGFLLGQAAGSETVTLTTQQIPSHGHVPQANGTASQPSPASNVWAAASPTPQFSNETPAITMATQAIGSTGGSQPHDNMLPFLAINFIIALFGVFPSQS